MGVVNLYNSNIHTVHATSAVVWWMLAALHYIPLLSWVPSLMSAAGRSIAEGDLIFDLNAYLTSTPCARQVLVQTLQDSFEANKEVALQLLLELPVDVDLFEVLMFHMYCVKVHFYRLQ